MGPVQLLLDGVGDMYMVQPFVFQLYIAYPYHAGRYTHSGAVGINGVQQYGVGGDLAVIAHPHGAQHLGAATHHYIAPQCGMALAGILAGAAQGNALIQRAAIAYLCRFADDDAGAMIDKNIVPDDGAWVDLDTGKKRVSWLTRRARKSSGAGIASAPVGAKTARVRRRTSAVFQSRNGQRGRADAPPLCPPGSVCT